MDLGLRDKVIIVTGGGAGIGAAITRACLDEDARVVVLSRRSENVQEFMEKWLPPAPVANDRAPVWKTWRAAGKPSRKSKRSMARSMAW